MRTKKKNMLHVAVVVVGLPLFAMADVQRQCLDEDVDDIQRIEMHQHYLLGNRLYYGQGCDRDLPAAFEHYLEAADMGYAAAEHMLACCYHNGYGVECDMRLAVEWCERAANHGHVRAMFDMGIYRHSGMGGVKNASEACQWFRMAAQHGMGDPDFDSGLDESEDCGQEASLAWIANMAENGDANSIYWYSRCFACGWGVPRDDSIAEELLVEAALRGHSLAKGMVGRDKWYGRLPGGREEGLELVIKAAEEGSATAYLYLEKLGQTGQM